MGRFISLVLVASLASLSTSNARRFEFTPKFSPPNTKPCVLLDIDFNITMKMTDGLGEDYYYLNSEPTQKINVTGSCGPQHSSIILQFSKGTMWAFIFQSYANGTVTLKRVASMTPKTIFGPMAYRYSTPISFKTPAEEISEAGSSYSCNAEQKFDYLLNNVVPGNATFTIISVESSVSAQGFNVTDGKFSPATSCDADIPTTHTIPAGSIATPNTTAKDPRIQEVYSDNETYNETHVEHVEVVERHCIEEEAPPAFELPMGICRRRNDSCKHELVSLSNGRHIMCDTETDGGGWIIMQRRKDFRMTGRNFFKDVSYRKFRDGFGDKIHNFWIGLETIHRMCPPKEPCEMRTDLIVKEGYEEYYIHHNVSFAGAWDNYRIRAMFVESFGNDGDKPVDLDHREFATVDHPRMFAHCVHWAGGWWYGTNCTDDSLNIHHSDHFRFSEIKLRPMHHLEMMEAMGHHDHESNPRGTV